MEQENVFVFVVCGGAEHINTLHYSLASLQKVSKHRIIVLTDSSRNEVPIVHAHIIDVKTPEHLNHHQASIYLKTGAYRFLPKGNLYCYLDTDVIALDEQVNDIFQYYKPPVTFAPDHCVADQFSPSAVNCGCAEKFAQWEKELKYLFVQYKHLYREPEDEQKKQKLLYKLEEIKKRKWYYRWVSLRFNLSRNIFKLDDDNFLDKRRKLWVDKNGRPVLYETDVSTIENSSPYRLDKADGKRWLREGVDVFDARCTHLHDAIQQTFNVKVAETTWQHWNGGVFIFDARSETFLDEWHHKTMQIFTRPEWKTRDQGTLIATVWQMGLQQHPVLPPAFNLIADYGHQMIKHTGGLHFRYKNVVHTVKPHFIHIYHHWADKAWDVWQQVEQATGIVIDPDSSTINALWIGPELSKIELLTIHSFLRHGYRFRLWLYEPLLTPLPNEVIIGDANKIIPREKIFRYKNKSQFGHGKGSVAGFSDIFRYKLLHDYGGWWVDMDITCIKHFYYDKPYYFRKHHNLKVVGNVMKCPKGSLLMKRCYEEAIANVDEHNTDWHKPINILNKHIEALHLNSYIVNGNSNQDRWDDTSRFVFGAPDIPDEWNFIHWQNEEWRNQNLDKNNVYHGSCLAKLLLHYGLYEPPKSRMAQWFNKISLHPYTRQCKRIIHRFTSSV